jgi:PPP family 3-phenylpropionic acid transporter
MLRDPGFLAVMISAALIQASHAGYYTFSAIAWQSVGLSTTTISLLWAVGIVAEIVLFALSPRLRISSVGLVICGGFAGVVRWVLVALDPPVAVVVAAQALHALSFGATFLGTINLVARLAPSRRGASAQGYIAICSGLITAGVSALCGYGYAAFGLSIYFGMAVMALAGSIVMLAGRHSIARSLAASAP